MAGASVLNTLRYNSELCIGCELCSIVCPHAVFVMNDLPAQAGDVAELVRPEACMECGACQLNCPTEAITVESGVGCAAAMMWAALTGKKEASCGDGGIATACCGSGSEAVCCDSGSDSPS